MAEQQLQCVVVTPETTVLDSAADFVAVTLVDGELGVLPGRAPLVARLGYGELRTRVGEKLDRYYVDGGFLQISNDVVTVLTPKAIPASQIDSAAAQEGYEQARKIVPSSPGQFEAKEKEMLRNRAQIATGRKR